MNYIVSRVQTFITLTSFTHLIHANFGIFYALHFVFHWIHFHLLHKIKMKFHLILVLLHFFFRHLLWYNELVSRFENFWMSVFFRVCGADAPFWRFCWSKAFLLNKHLICFRMTKPVSRGVINAFNYLLEVCVCMEIYAMATLNGFREIETIMMHTNRGEGVRCRETKWGCRQGQDPKTHYIWKKFNFLRAKTVEIRKKFRF